MKIYQLKKNRWKTVGAWFGLGRRIYFSVETNQQCRWRRIPVPGWGKFTGKRSVFLWDSVVQVKSPVDTVCKSSFNEQDLD